MKRDYILQTTDNHPLQITTYGNEQLGAAPTIIFAHGFKGFKDWGFVPPLGEYLATQGFFVITFNFSHNGIGTVPTEFGRLDLFERNTFSREVSELTQVVYAWQRGFFGDPAQSSLGIVGHSRGGAISLLTSSTLPEVGACVTWSAVSHLHRYSEKQVKLWREQGYLEAVNQRTKQVMRLGVGLLDDIEQNRDDSLSVEKAGRDLQKPLLIIHGKNDDGVPVREAEELYSWSDQQQTELQIIPDTGHTFGAVHPWAGMTQEFEQVLDSTATFFKIHLG
jgi:dipeptidyl aminopeptidase/acylaminoacyl peptidase